MSIINPRTKAKEKAAKAAKAAKLAKASKSPRAAKRIAVSSVDSSMLALPDMVISKADISHLIRDAEYVDTLLTTQTVRRKAGAKDTSKVFIPGILAEYLAINKLQFDDSTQRTAIIRQLRELKDDVPVLNMTFSVPADRESLARLTKWVRASVHQQAIIEAGLQPSLIAGVVLRTPNHVHDFSLRAVMKEGRDVLLSELEARRGTR